MNRSVYEPGRVHPWLQVASNDAKKMIRFKRKLVQRYNGREQFLFQKEEYTVVPMATLRRKTHLFSFLVLLCQFAIVDTVNFLPLGITLYSAAINICLEIFSDQNDVFLTSLFGEEFPEQDSTELQEQEKEFRRIYDAAKFEYHVLKKKPKTTFARVRDRDGRTKLFVV